MLHGKNILITGAAGSVSRAIIPYFLEAEPNVLRLLDNNEPGLAGLRSQYEDERCRFLAGDVRDVDRLHRAMEDVDIVVHTAAMKHVDVCEYNPFEAVKTNVIGLQNVVDTAIDAGVTRVVFTSSDKAVNPANTMGTTKLLGEKLITAGNKHRGRTDIKFTTVRFGNVINSSQSVIPLFAQQIARGGPVQLTDTRMTRFFLTYTDVFCLVTRAMELTQGGEVFVYKMPAIKIEDLAEAMIHTLAPEHGFEPNEIELELIGRRPGETFHEEIMTALESSRAYETDDLYAILPEEEQHLPYNVQDEFNAIETVDRSSEHAPKLSVEEISSLLKRNGVRRLVDV